MTKLKSFYTLFTAIVIVTVLPLTGFYLGRSTMECEHNEAKEGLSWDVNISAYCPCKICCGIYADGVTASGHVIQEGDKFVAAPPEIPFGEIMDIPGYGIVPVLDRGGSIKGNRLDVYFDTHQEALNWGRQYLKVRVR